MPERRTPVDIEGLRDAFNRHEISIPDCLAKSFAKLEELAEEDEPSKAKEFQARICFGLIRGCSQILKVRPELGGKAAGSASTSDLISAAIADADCGGTKPLAALQGTRAPILRLAPPDEEDQLP
jgi:hypothetical protein